MMDKKLKYGMLTISAIAVFFAGAISLNSGTTQNANSVTAMPTVTAYAMTMEEEEYAVTEQSQPTEENSATTLSLENEASTQAAENLSVISNVATGMENTAKVLNNVASALNKMAGVLNTVDNFIEGGLKVFRFFTNIYHLLFWWVV